MGDGANASGNGTANTAVGAGAIATQTNSAAFGALTVTDRSNQQKFGTVNNTYTMTGVNRAQSRNAQVGALSVVTSDAQGNLPARTAADMGLASAGDVSGLQSQIDGLADRDNELAEGIAISIALAQPFFHAGQTFAVNVGWGGYDGENAFGVTAAGIVDKGAFGPTSTTTLHGGVGAGAGQGQVAGRAGVSFGW